MLRQLKKLKKVLMKLELEQTTKIQLNEQTYEPEVTEVSTTTSFDLWTYHTSKGLNRFIKKY